MRLLAASVVVLGGAICVGLQSAASPSGHSFGSSPAHVVGPILLILGGLAFAIEFVRSNDNGPTN